MEPITSAILAVLGKLADKTISDGYAALRDYLLKKYADSELDKALTDVESGADDSSTARLDSALRHSGASADSELLKRAVALAGRGGTHIEMHGHHNAAVGENHGTLNIDLRGD